MTNEEKTAVERCEVVVDSVAVESYSQRGYRTIEIREEDISTVQYVNDQQVLSGNSYPTTIPKQVPVVLRVLRFHMVRDGESHIAELSVLLESTEVERNALKDKVDEGDKVIAALKSESEKATQNSERHLKSAMSEQKLVVELRESLRKMEEMIAKIRKEIGEQRWRDITMDPSDQKMIAAEKARIASLDLDDAEVQTGT